MYVCAPRFPRPTAGTRFHFIFEKKKLFSEIDPRDEYPERKFWK